MAHFAKLDENNIVTEIVVLNNEVILKADGTESEYKGKVFLNQLFGNANWVQSSINCNFRKNHATIGSIYDEEKDAFIYPKPYDNWSLNEDTCQWEAPIPYPNDGEPYYWDIENNNWVKI